MSRYFLIEQGIITFGPIELPAAWRNVSGLNLAVDALLKTYGWLPEIQVGNDPFDSATHIKTGPVFTIGADSVTSTYTISVKTLADLKTQRKIEADEEADRRFLLLAQTDVDAFWGFAKAIGQLDNSGAGGGTVGAGILAGITALQDLKDFRNALKTAIDSMTQQQLIDLDITDDSHWTA